MTLRRLLRMQLVSFIALTCKRIEVDQAGTVLGWDARWQHRDDLRGGQYKELESRQLPEKTDEEAIRQLAERKRRDAKEQEHTEFCASANQLSLSTETDPTSIWAGQKLKVIVKAVNYIL
jgi:hypothetical protein